MMKRSYMPPQILMCHHVVMPVIMAGSGETEETNKKVGVDDDTVGENEEYWFRAKHHDVWDDSEAFK